MNRLGAASAVEASDAFTSDCSFRIAWFGLPADVPLRPPGRGLADDEAAIILLGDSAFSLGFHEQLLRSPEQLIALRLHVFLEVHLFRAQFFLASQCELVFLSCGRYLQLLGGLGRLDLKLA